MKILLSALFCASATLVWEAQAQIVISQFSFEIVTPPDIGGASAGPFNADFGPGALSAFHASSATNYSTPAGNGSANAFSADHWGAGDYFQLSLSSVGFSNLFVTFALGRSGTGPDTFQMSYSTDGGLNFSLVGSPIAVSSTAFSGSSYHASFVSTFDLSGIAALNNNSNVVFRLAAVTSASSTAGTVRLDDFILSSGGPVTVPEPAVFAGLAFAAALGGCCWFGRGR